MKPPQQHQPFIQNEWNKRHQINPLPITTDTPPNWIQKREYPTIRCECG